MDGSIDGAFSDRIAGVACREGLEDAAVTGTETGAEAISIDSIFSCFGMMDARRGLFDAAVSVNAVGTTGVLGEGVVATLGRKVVGGSSLGGGAAMEEEANAAALAAADAGEGEGREFSPSELSSSSVPLLGDDSPEVACASLVSDMGEDAALGVEGPSGARGILTVVAPACAEGSGTVAEDADTSGVELGGDVAEGRGMGVSECLGGTIFNFLGWLSWPFPEFVWASSGDLLRFRFWALDLFLSVGVPADLKEVEWFNDGREVLENKFPIASPICRMALLASSISLDLFSFFSSFSFIPRLKVCVSSGPDGAVGVGATATATAEGVDFEFSFDSLRDWPGSTGSSSRNGSPVASACAFAFSIFSLPRPLLTNSRRIIVSLGTHIAFFFICFRRRAISHAVSFNQGIHLLPGWASSGGGVSCARALLVEMPATALWTFVPMTPTWRCFGCLGILTFCILTLFLAEVPT
jgi:hypothetical protein